MRARVPRRLAGEFLGGEFLGLLERVRTAADITDWHTVLVDCDSGPNGKHKVHLHRAESEVVYLAGECDLKAGDAIARLGGHSCATVVSKLQSALRARSKVYQAYTSTDRIDPRTKQKAPSAFELPAAIKDVLWDAQNFGDTKRKQRGRAPRDRRPLLVRLLEKHLREQVPALNLKVAHGPIESSSETKPVPLEDMHMLRVYVAGSRTIAFRRSHGWMQHGYERSTSDMGYQGDHCLVCRKHAGKKWDSIKLHLRGREHGENVVVQVKKVLVALSKLGRPRGDE